MNDSKISVRYAKALFESAEEQNVLDTVRTDMEEVQKVSVLPGFKHLIINPVIKESQKCAVIDEIFKGKVHPLTLSLLNLIFRNGRELFLSGIARNFLSLYKKHKGIKSALLTSAVPVSEQFREKVEKIIQKAVNSKVELRTESNSDLIGGFIIRIDDQQYDASVSNSLKKMKKQLLK